MIAKDQYFFSAPHLNQSKLILIKSADFVKDWMRFSQSVLFRHLCYYDGELTFKVQWQILHAYQEENMLMWSEAEPWIVLPYKNAKKVWF